MGIFVKFPGFADRALGRHTACPCWTWHAVRCGNDLSPRVPFFFGARDSRLGDSIKLDFSICMLPLDLRFTGRNVFARLSEGEVTCLPSVGWCHRTTVFFAV